MLPSSFCPWTWSVNCMPSEEQDALTLCREGEGRRFQDEL